MESVVDVSGALEEALSLHHQGRLADAERLYREVLRSAPDNADALNLLGALAMQTGALPPALALIDRALAANPRMAPAHYNRGAVLRAQGRPADACASFDAAIALKPDYAEAFSGRGAALHDLHHLPEAAQSFARAIALGPPNADACSNLAKVLLDLGRPQDAILACDQAIALAPELAEAHFNKSLGLLMLGDYAEGFKLYEWRRGIDASIGARAAGQPSWTGAQNVAGKTVFLTWEQGFGDTIQFCRYVPRVRALGARVIVSVQAPLRRLMAQLGPDVEIIGEGEAPAAFDYATPLMSLPRAFGETLDTLKPAPPYLAADPALAAAWRARLSGLPGVKVGLAWAGGAKPGNLMGTAVDERRSIPLSAFGPLVGVAGVSFVSLQKGPAAAGAATTVLNLFDAADELSDFADTAALIEALDLVVTVDTAVAHLAAAMGKPVWILNRFDTCWRWMREREDSPWYPSVRLFRQSAPGDWAPAVARVAVALGEVAAAQT